MSDKIKLRIPRITANAAIAALLLMSAIPFAHAEDSPKPVTLKVFRLPDPRKTDPFTLADRAVIAAFKKKYPYITLKQFSGIQIEGMAMDSKPLMAIAGGVSPDIIYVNFRQSDTYIQNNFLYPMDEFFDKIPEKLKKLRVAGPVWPVIKRKGPGGVHVWAMPYGTLVRVLVYRKDLFYKVGLDPNKPPKTWDELLEYARRLTQPELGTFGIRLAMGPAASWDWITYLWSAGGDAVIQDEKGVWHATFNSRAGVDAMEFYLKLVTTKWKDASGKEHTGYILTEDVNTQGHNLWDEGKIGMTMTYMDDKYLGKMIDPNLVGVAPVPLGPTGKRGSEINCTMMGIFSGAGKSNNSGLGPRDPKAVRDAAWKYIWFYDSEEARKIRIKKMIEAGYGKMQNPIYLKRYGYTEYLKYTQPGWLETFEEAIKNGKPEPYGRNCQLVYNFMTTPIHTCVSEAEKGKLGVTREERRKRIKEILDIAVKRTNEQMIGNLTPDERKKRNSVAFLVAMFVALVFMVVLWRVWMIFTPKDGGARVQGWLFKKYFFAYLIMLPAIGSIILWKYVPMFMGSVMAFQDYQIVGDSQWIGFQNFADVIYDPVWWSALSKTLFYMFLFLMLAFWPPIVLAILLQEVSHGKLIYRTLYYLPAVITGVIVIYLWKLMYLPTDAGAFNQILLALGWDKPVRWLKDENLAMICCVVPLVWSSMGPGCLIYLAALKGIPDDSYEAADIDGANFFQKIRHIVFPNLKALVIIQLIAAFIASSQQSGFILVMTFGGPNEATKVAGLLIFEKAYLYLKFGIATTMAWMLGIMLLGFTVVQLRKLSNMEFKAQGSK